MSSTLTDIENFVESRLAGWLALLQRLVRERSVFEHEQGAVEIVAACIGALGLDVIRVPHDTALLESLSAAQPPISRTPERCSLVTRVRGSGSGRSLAFNTHLDVVPEGDASAWTYAPFAGHIDVERGVLYGRGAMDDKAGVVIALAVLETLVRGPVLLQGDVIFHFVLEDETTGNGSLLCLHAGHGADAAVMIDGTRPNRAIDSNAGQLEFGIRVVGKPASVSVSHLGVNAAHVIAGLVTHLNDAVLALNVTREGVWRNFPSPFQLVTCQLASRGEQLTVPVHAEARCHMTFPPPWTLQRAREFLSDATANFSHSHGLAVAPVLDFDGMQVEPIASNAAELVAVLRTCAAAVGYQPPEPGPLTGTSDMRHFAAAGIPCLLYGPGNGFNPHRADEHYRLDDLPRMIRLFVALAETWCGAATETA